MLLIYVHKYDNRCTVAPTLELTMPRSSDYSIIVVTVHLV